MSDKNELLRELLDEFKQSYKSLGQSLRVNLSEIVIGGLKEKNWTQRDLARETKICEPTISRIIHSDVNCTLDTAARVLFALEVQARLTKDEYEPLMVSFGHAASELDTSERSFTSNGQEKIHQFAPESTAFAAES